MPDTPPRTPYTNILLLARDNFAKFHGVDVGKVSNRDVERGFKMMSSDKSCVESWAKAIPSKLDRVVTFIDSKQIWSKRRLKTVGTTTRNADEIPSRIDVTVEPKPATTPGAPDSMIGSAENERSGTDEIAQGSRQTEHGNKPPLLSRPSDQNAVREFFG